MKTGRRFPSARFGPNNYRRTRAEISCRLLRHRRHHLRTRHPRRLRLRRRPHRRRNRPTCGSARWARFRSECCLWMRCSGVRNLNSTNSRRRRLLPPTKKRKLAFCFVSSHSPFLDLEWCRGALFSLLNPSARADRVNLGRFPIEINLCDFRPRIGRPRSRLSAPWGGCGD